MSSFDVRSVNLNLLPALEALLLEGSVGAAARRLHVTQSAMSHSLRKLREALGDPLLVPHGRRLVLTPHAKEVRARLPSALDDLGAAVRPPTFDPRTSTRTFRIATVDYFEMTTLPALLAYLRVRAPRVRLEIERFAPAHLAALEAGELDVVLTGGTGPWPEGARHTPLYDDPFVVIVRPDHPAVRRRLDLATYLRLGHVLVSVEGRRDGVVDRVLAARGLSRQVALRVPHFAAAPLAVRHSDWLCTIARTVAVRARQLFGVRVLASPLPLPPAPVAMLTPRRRARDPASEWLRAFFLRPRPGAAPR